jgi:hypothetical protein
MPDALLSTLHALSQLSFSSSVLNWVLQKQTLE